MKEDGRGRRNLDQGHDEQGAWVQEHGVLQAAGLPRASGYYFALVYYFSVLPL